MVDIHTHIIPFVDDGAKSIEQSIDMIKHEISIGVKRIYCTPHHIYQKYESPIEEIKQQFELLKSKVQEENLDVELLLGQEIYYTTRENIIKKLDEHKLRTMNGTKYILLEFSFVDEPDDIYELVYNFECHGYKVIIAHVERYDWMTIDKVIGLRQEGAIIQVNAGSVVDETTRKEFKFVKKLFKKNLVDIIASDTHHFRPSSLDKAIKKSGLEFNDDFIK